MKPKRFYNPRPLSCEGLPNRIRAERMKLNMSLGAVANYLGVTIQTVHEAETKGSGLSKQNWYKLADLFDLDPRVLEAA